MPEDKYKKLVSKQLLRSSATMVTNKTNKLIKSSNSSSEMSCEDI